MAATPHIYYMEQKPFVDTWIAEGTDGILYLVPAEPGGWLHRDTCQRCKEQLVPVSQTKAITIKWFVYGDVGVVTILTD